VGQQPPWQYSTYRQIALMWWNKMEETVLVPRAYNTSLSNMINSNLESFGGCSFVDLSKKRTALTFTLQREWSGQTFFNGMQAILQWEFSIDSQISNREIGLQYR